MRGRDQKRVERARSLRHALTPAEFALWTRLRGRQLGGFDRYYVDFVCRERRLIIELDGGQPAEQEGELKDAVRTAYLSEQGYRVMRFWNEQVNTEIENVLEAMYAALTDS